MGRVIAGRVGAVAVGVAVAAGVGTAAVAAVVAAPLAAQEPVAIGLVLPADAPAGGVAAAVRAGAEAAVRRANEDGGFRGRPFALRIVSEEGLWGQGLGKVVGLAFDEPVWGVVGGLDGRSAHLIQQVVVKARIPFLTPWASDHTLGGAMVPWFFQALPDDRQQAETMIAAAVALPGAGEVLLVADTTYDSRQLADAVRRAAAAAGAPVHQHDPAGAASWLGGVEGGAGPRAVILACQAEAAARLLDRLGGRPSAPPVFAPIRLAIDLEAGAARGNRPTVWVPGPAGSAARTARAGGSAAPSRGDAPKTAAPEAVAPEAAAPGTAGPAAAYAHDAVWALVEAVRAAGLDHRRIRDALARGSVEGATGRIEFDGSGRRAGRWTLRAAGCVVGPARECAGAPSLSASR